MTFDPKKLAASARKSNTRYERRLAELERRGINISRIRATVDRTAANVAKGERSFVIYGEPQSGKTEMMIALTAKLLDDGHRIIIVLVNDSVQLMRQNLRRFQEARLHPASRHFEDVLAKEQVLTSGEWIIFCKKNPHDLRKLTEKVLSVTDGIVVIDDEADYATPNAKVNSKNDQSRINQLVGELLEPKGTYIGVTATPARLNLNNTYNNQAEKWVIFEPHEDYYGHKAFFPPDYEKRLKNGTLGYRLELLPDQHDDDKYLREALFRFLISVAHLNSFVNDSEQNYCMLVHTSGVRADHTVDYKQILSIFSAISDENHKSFESYFRQIHAVAEQRFPGEGEVIARYIYENAGRYVPVVMNSDRQGSGDYETATSPTTPFTVAIGGNIVSRGVTFNNLLGMFFTRDVKHKIQQDTYIQRARMFGSRGAYFKYFELTIPRQLYRTWNRCFLFHTLALAAIESTKTAPLWLEDPRIAAAAASSIDRATVSVDSGEMAFGQFSYNEATIAPLCDDTIADSRARLRRLQTVVGSGALPDYLLSFILGMSPNDDASVAIHKPSSISNRKDVTIDQEQISRKRGFIGTPQLQRTLFPQALHHIQIFFNANGKARVFYKYDSETGGVRFITTRGRGRAR